MVLPQFLNPGGTRRSVVLPAFLAPGGPSTEKPVGYRPVRSEGEFTFASLAGFRFVGDPLAFAPGAPLYDPQDLLLRLGYTDYETFDTYIERRMQKTLNSAQENRLCQILEQLDSIDSAVFEGILDSAVTKTCKTELGWARHIALLKRQGHTLIHELGRIFDVPVLRSKYVTPKKKRYSVSYQ